MITAGHRLIDIVYHRSMKLTLQTQILPDATDAARLKTTVERFNEAADWLAGVAFERKVSNGIARKLTARASRNSRVVCAGIARMPISSGPGTSRPGPGCKSWHLKLRNRGPKTA
jgi:hypothetical protein